MVVKAICHKPDMAAKICRDVHLSHRCDPLDMVKTLHRMILPGERWKATQLGEGGDALTSRGTKANLPPGRSQIGRGGMGHAGGPQPWELISFQSVTY